MRSRGWTHRDLVFTDERGEPLAESTLRSVFRAALGSPDPLPRPANTAATIALGRDVHPKIVSEMLGHSQIAVTLDLYSHVTPTMQREAAAAMDALLS